MECQLLPPRFLNSANILLNSRSAFTFHLKTLTFSSNPSFSTSSIRILSVRSARSRDNGRGGFRAAAGGHGKSLIEDEAELSDWVSDLKSNSFRLGLSSSDNEDLDQDKKKSVKRNERDGRVRDSGGFSDKRSLRSSVGFLERSSRGSLSKKRFDSNPEEDRRNSRGSLSKKRFDSNPEDRRNSRGLSGLRSSRSSVRYPETNPWVSLSKRRFGSDLEDKRSLRSSFGVSERSSRGSLSKKQFDSNPEEDRRNSRGSSGLRSSRSSVRYPERNPRGSLSKRRFGSDLGDEEKEEKEEFLSKQRRGQGSSLSFTRRGGRDVESSYKQVRNSVLEISEEEEEEDYDDDNDVSGFGDDLSGHKVDGKKVGMTDSLLKSGNGSSSELGDGVIGKPVLISSGEDMGSYLSETRFDQCSIAPLTLKGIKAAGYERMTFVQEATLPVILKGKDVLAKAKTGTGKTVAFLLPAIEIVSKLPPVDRDQKRTAINVLVICPTRELADQAATEASILLKFHPSIGVQVVIGGTRLALEQKCMQANPCQILVATPGRLRDHIENTPGFATRLMGVKVLVLDEADHLLDMGFRKDIEKIIAAIPKQRQTLLFSATVPDEVRQICYIAMKRDHEFVNTVEEGSEETHCQVRQMHLVAPLNKQFPTLYGLLTDHISEDIDYKVIVFCTTAMVTKLVADLLSELRLNVREIHSRKTQSYRTRISKEFKESKGLILVSSDVSARGVDYPDVTLVIQVGVPADREQYIHRLGRTGRKGKEGKGILLLAPWEEFFLPSIKDLPITQAPVPLVDPDTIKKVEQALGHVDMKNKESAYQAWLGYYNSNKNVGRDKYNLVLLANEFSSSMGLDNPPAITKLVLRKMGLSNVPGLRAK